MSFRLLTDRLAPGRWRARPWGLIGLLGLASALTGSACRGKEATPPPPPPPPQVEPAAKFAPDEAVVLLHSAHDTIGAARAALEAALRLPVDLPLPFPRVEKHGDQFRVVLARGPFAQLRPLINALSAAQKPGPEAVPVPVPVQVQAVGQAGSDDVVRLAIVCSPSDTVPLLAMPTGGTQAPGKELSRLRHGQVLALKEEDEGPSSAHDDEGGEDDGHAPTLVEQGYLSVLQPQLGLVHAPDVLLPADCTPRDEDNDDGNGRILTGTTVGAPKPGQVGRLCLTTRFAGKHGRQTRADLLAVSPNYRRCLRFPGAGTFDGFDHSRDGSHFAVEVLDGRAASPATPGPAAASPATAPVANGPVLRVYAVNEAAPGHSGLSVRAQWPGLSRPAFLADHLIALGEDAAGVALWSVDGLGKRSAQDSSPLPAPRRLVLVALPGLPPLADKLQAVVHRPAAPTLSGDRVKASFLRSCPSDLQKRVRAQAGRSYVACLFELEVEVALDGTHVERRCHIDNAENPLEEPPTVPCPQ